MANTAAMPQASGTLAVVGDTVALRDMGTVLGAAFTITGTFTGLTVVTEGSMDGTTWFACAAISASGGAVTTQPLTASSSTYTGQFFGTYFPNLRLRCTAITTGSASVAMLGGSVPVSPPLSSVALSAGTSRAGFVAASGIWKDDTSTPLAASATYTGSSCDCAAVATATAFNSASTYAEELRVSAVADVAGTLYLEVSRDNTTWRRVKAAPLAQADGTSSFAAEIIHRPSTRYARLVFVNGAGAQGYFHAQTFMLAA